LAAFGVFRELRIAAAAHFTHLGCDSFELIAYLIAVHLQFNQVNSIGVLRPRESTIEFSFRRRDSSFSRAAIATNKPRSTADAPTTSTSAARIFSGQRIVADAINTADAVSRVLGLLRSLTDALTTGESSALVRSALRSCSDNPVLAESLARVLTATRADTEAITTCLVSAPAQRGNSFSLQPRSTRPQINVIRCLDRNVVAKIRTALRSPQK
jgi:hypothetical protein